MAYVTSDKRRSPMELRHCHQDKFNLARNGTTDDSFFDRYYNRLHRFGAEVGPSGSRRPAVSWSWWGLPGLLLLFAAWGAALIALLIRPYRQINRQLALVLFLEGVNAGFSTGLIFILDNEQWARLVAMIGTSAAAALPLQYLIFLGASLNTPLVRIFRMRGVKWLFGILSVAASATVLLWPELFITDLYHPGWATWNFQYRGYSLVMTNFYGLASLFGLIAAIHVLRLSDKGTVSRNRAVWFAIAFGLRDSVIAILLLLFPLLRPIPFWGDVLYNPAQSFFYLVYVVLLAYGVLRSQLFGIDLKIRFAVQQGTVGALVAGTFLIASELLEDLFPVDGLALGVLLALTIAIVLRPAQRIAERVAQQLMPGVRQTSRYLEQRKLEVYRGALEAALEDNRITDTEQAIILRLREKLEISEFEARMIEKQVGIQPEQLNSSRP